MHGVEGERPKLADVAKLAGTSTAVVSYVINDGPRAVAPETRERVLAAVAALDYRPSRAARALRSRRSSFIGLVVPGTADPFYVQHAQAVEAAALEHGLLTMTGNSAFDPAREVELLAGLIDEGVAGLVVAGLGESERMRELLSSSTIRTVFLHNRPHGVAGPLVTVENGAWAEVAVEHLLGHGHTAVACLTHLDNVGPVGERYEGWQRAMDRNGGAAPELVLRSAHDRASASTVTAEWLRQPNRPRAIFAATDELAFGILHAAGVAGVRIPEDLAVFAFDGVPETATSVPELATIQEPFTLMGARTVELLFGENGDDLDAVHIFDCELVPRRSCGCDSPAA